MFAGFNLKIDQSFFCSQSEFCEYKKIGKNHLNADKIIYKKELKSYICNDTVDGTKVQNDWFPEITADIFISHSHRDEELAQALAGWLNETFGLRCFIDSNVWGYADDLLEDLNKEYSDKREQGLKTLYDHKSCNKVSQHVNIMLSIALQKMIDKTEAVILLNTDNSIKFTDGNTIDLTYSPWIYSEIICTQIVRQRPLILYRDYSCPYNALYESTNKYKMAFLNALRVSYEVSLKHLKKIEGKHLKKWEKKYDNAYNRDYPLDSFYEEQYPKELEKAKLVFQYLDSDSIQAIKECISGDGRDRDRLREKFGDLLQDKHCCCPVCDERYCRYMDDL